MKSATVGAVNRAAARARRLLRDERGQTLLPLAMAVVLFAIFAVIVADVGMLLATRRDSQNDVDRIALAGAVEMNLDDATQDDDRHAAIEAGVRWAENNGLPFDPTQVVIPATGNSLDINLDDGSTLTLEVLNAQTCFPTSTSTKTAVGMRATLQDRSSPTFLASFVGIDALTTGATASACAGRPTEQFGVMPFAVSKVGMEQSCYVEDATGDPEPVYGALCDIRVGGPTGGLLGALDIAIPQGPGDNVTCEDKGQGASTYVTNIASGTKVWCRIGDTVYAAQGVVASNTRDGIRTRLQAEGNCDSTFAAPPVSGTTPDLEAAWLHLGDYLQTVLAQHPTFTGYSMLNDPAANDGMDDFYEIWEYPGADAENPALGLAAYDCDRNAEGHQTSIRNVVMIVVQDYANPDFPGPKAYIVRDFARLYIEGCTNNDTLQFIPDCDIPTNVSDFTIHGRFALEKTADDVDLGPEGQFGEIQVFLDN